jgi:peroxiredoxin
MGIHRMTYLLDECRKIKYIFLKVSPAGHASEVLSKLNCLC